MTRSAPIMHRDKSGDRKKIRAGCSTGFSSRTSRTSSEKGMRETERFLHAEVLHIIDGFPLSRVAEITGLRLEELEATCVRDHWQERRREFVGALLDIRRNTTMLRKRLIEKALDSLDPRDISAVARLETAAAREKPAWDVLSFHLSDEKTIQVDPIDALQKAVERKTALMLHRPENLSLQGIRELKEALQIIETLKLSGKDEEKNRTSRGLSEARIEEIRRKILGICE